MNDKNAGRKPVWAERWIEREKWIGRKRQDRSGGGGRIALEDERMAGR